MTEYILPAFLDLFTKEQMSIFTPHIQMPTSYMGPMAARLGAVTAVMTAAQLPVILLEKSLVLVYFYTYYI